jgi:radical SAM/Cys-rich protein
MRDTLPLLDKIRFPAIRRAKLETLQVNVGYRCNQSCFHCHVNAGPNRTEEMTAEVADVVLDFVKRRRIKTLDITGGAPELNAQFRRLVRGARKLGAKVMDRCNLTILEQAGQEDLAAFLAEQQAEVVASMPCYLQDNVERQRGKGVFAGSIRGLQKLNALGYGRDPALVLNLVYNPQGPSLPPAQAALEPTTSACWAKATASCSTSCSCWPTCRSSASARRSSARASSRTISACCRMRISTPISMASCAAT